MNRIIATILATALAALSSSAQAEGNFAKPPAERISLEIAAAGPTASQTEIQLETGKYYRLTIKSDGIGEVMFRAPQLWRNAWVNLMVIGAVELHAPEVEGIEFEEEPGEAAIAFVVLRPGEYAFTLEGATTVEGKFIVK